MTVDNDGFSVAQMRRADSVYFSATSDGYQFSSPPGSVGISYYGYRRNIHIQFHDFAQAMLSDSLIVTEPLDIRDLDLATISAGTQFGDSHIPAGFTGTIDRLYAIPEPHSGLLLAVGLAVASIYRRRSFISSAWRIAAS
jgi:hypothetical protein